MCDGFGRCVHDNELLGYTVDRTARTIAFHTKFDVAEPTEYTDLVFTGVLAYELRCDSFELGTILDGVTAHPGGAAVDWSPETFERDRKNGWPGEWNKTKDQARAHLNASKLRAFEIGSHIGLTGWVLAEEMDIVPSSDAVD